MNIHFWLIFINFFFWFVVCYRTMPSGRFARHLWMLLWFSHCAQLSTLFGHRSKGGRPNRRITSESQWPWNIFYDSAGKYPQTRCCCCCRWQSLPYRFIWYNACIIAINDSNENPPSSSHRNRQTECVWIGRECEKELNAIKINRKIIDVH